MDLIQDLQFTEQDQRAKQTIETAPGRLGQLVNPSMTLKWMMMISVFCKFQVSAASRLYIT